MIIMGPGRFQRKKGGDSDVVVVASDEVAAMEMQA